MTETEVTRTHWHDRWDAGQLGFHADAPNPVLLRYQDRLPKGRILVPLCGKTLDLWHLAEAGFEPVGVEFVRKAVEALFSERGVAAETESLEHGTRYRGGGIEVHAADFFAFTSTPFDGVWDRAALIALEPKEREAYAAHLLALLRPGGRMLLDTLDYDQSVIDGPPWATPNEQVRALYSDAGELVQLEENTPVAIPPRMQEAGAVGTESIWLLTKEGGSADE